MEAETWYKIYCKKCDSVNWLCDGNTEDLTMMDIDGFKCHNCGHVEIFNINILETIHDDKTIEEIIDEYVVNIVDGLKEPI